MKGISEDSELVKFMALKNIHLPSELYEFYVDSDTEIVHRTQEEYKKILERIKKLLPIYKIVVIKDEEDTFETKEGDVTYLNILTYRHYTFTDFNDITNLNNYRPIFCEVKREQEKEPRGILCWSNQYNTHYIGVKIYDINHEQRREEYEITSRYEGKTREDDEAGEQMKEDLLNALKLQININENEENDKVINYKEKPNNNYIGNILSEK